MAQITGKFIGANEVKDEDIRLDNGDYLRARNAANNADVNIIRVNSSDQIEFPSIPFAAGTPTNGNQVANKSYVDGITSGFIVSSITSTTSASASTQYLANASGGAFTVNLPAAASSTNARIIVQKTDSTTNEVTLDGNGSETINGATTYVLYIQYDAVEVVCNGTAWFVARAFELENSEIRLNGQNGYGSSGTTTARFTNVTTNVGSAMTLTQSATNGDSITINKPGNYAMTYQAVFNVSNRDFGVTKNGTSSTNISAQTVDTNVLVMKRAVTSGVPDVASVTVRLAKNDVIRFQTDAGALNSTNFTQASIKYLGN